MQIDLIYFNGCPHAAMASENVRAAIERLGAEVELTDWDLMADSTPEHFRRYGSPTVLVNGKDVTGERHKAVAMACRADGAPSVEVIAKALT